MTTTQKWLLIFLLMSSAVFAEPSYDYPKIFGNARNLLTTDQSNQFLNEIYQSTKKEKNSDILNEQQIVQILIQHPEYWTIFDKYLTEYNELNKKHKNENNLKNFEEKWTPILRDLFLKSLNHEKVFPLVLNTHNGKPGYTDLKLYFNHPHVYKNKILPADNILSVWLNFINQAKKEIAINVYQFDVTEIADALISKAKEGLNIICGIDRDVINTSWPTKVVYYKLSNASKKYPNLIIKGIDSYGRNHQKMAAFDWSLPDNSKVILSSANLTYADLDPEGDVPQAEFSIPNANNLLTMNSFILANIIQHEITKTVILKLKGDKYPLTTAYKIFGEMSPATAKQTYLIITFTPNGALRSINKNILSKLIKEKAGKISIIAFSFASNILGDAFYSKAKEMNEKKQLFDFIGVGDRPSTLDRSSEFLSMSGLKHIFVIRNGLKYTEYVEPQDGFTKIDYNAFRWKKLYGDHFTQFQDRIRVPAYIYGEHIVKVNERNLLIKSRVHHKVLAISNYSVIGNSFNFSSSAERNNEQFVLLYDPQIAEYVHDMVRGMANESKSSVFEEAMRINKYLPLMKKTYETLTNED